jgi:predicted AAA+ superfamily ATPase
LKASFVVFELPPFFENIKKRVIKTPKLYFCDPGLAAFLLGIETQKHVYRDPLRGGLYENLLITEVLKQRYNSGLRPEMFFFRDSNGNEVDLVLRKKLIPKIY